MLVVGSLLHRGGGEDLSRSQRALLKEESANLEVLKAPSM